MHIEYLNVKRFRNFGELSLAFNPRINAIIGQNAQGKTNILEAIYSVIYGKSFRTRQDKELIKAGEKDGHIALGFYRSGRSQTLEMRLDHTGRKCISINQVPIKKTYQLIGALNIVLFAPEDLSLVKAGPAERRKFLDRELSHINRRYLDDLISYHRVLNQRNSLLKQSSSSRDIAVWDDQLVHYGSAIIERRLAFIEAIAQRAKPVQLALSSQRDELSMTYQSPFITKNGTIDCDAMRMRLQHNHARDIQLGYTTVGPHRDDLAISLNGMSLKKYGSQGQQRSVVLAFKIALIDMIEDTIDERPILLLDDVMSELDIVRQTKLLDYITNTQTLLTTTDLNGINRKHIQLDAVFQIANGALKATEEVNIDNDE